MEPPAPPPPPEVKEVTESRIKVGISNKIKEQMSTLKQHSLNIFRFNPKSKNWEVPTINTLEIKTKRVKVLTFNILFASTFGHLRHPHLLEIVRQQNPDVAAFQEVTKPFVDYLMQLPFVQENYFIFDMGNTVIPYGCFIISKFPPQQVLIEEFPTKMARKLVKCRFYINRRIFDIGTVHLESYEVDRPWRKQQLEISYKSMETSQDAVLMGDFNFGDGSEQAEIPSDYMDCWKSLYPTDPGYTFDYSQNKMLEGLGTYSILRLDRILLKSKESYWKPISMEIIGKNKLPIDTHLLPLTPRGLRMELWPSDHFGLVSVLETKDETLENPRKIPVILDTDIGEYIDDQFALSFLLRSPEIDIKLISIGGINTEVKAAIVAKFLITAKASHIPIVIGHSTSNNLPIQAEYAKGFNLKKYPGKIYQFNEISEAYINTITSIEKDKQRGVLLAIGPMWNLARVMQTHPEVAERLDLVAQIGMFADQNASWNIECALPEAVQVLSARWNSIHVIPYDVCRHIALDHLQYKLLLDSKLDFVKDLIKNHKLFLNKYPKYAKDSCTTLFDVGAAIALVYPSVFVFTENYVGIDNSSKTSFTSPGNGFKANVALQWNGSGLQFTVSLLLQRLLS